MEGYLDSVLTAEDTAADTSNLPTSTRRFTLTASFRTDIGCHREVNEDSWLWEQPRDETLLREKGVLALIADGMGGHAAGDVASKLAATVISTKYYSSHATPHDALAPALHAANRAIYQAAQKQPHLRGMGTTCVALVLWQDVALSATVGDSRLYLVRDEQIYLMSEDHSAVMELVRQGAMSLAEARRHADKNIILRALGPLPDVEVSLWQTPFPIRHRDQFVLCSDGLYDLVSDEEIRQAAMSQAPADACEYLILLARERGGYDNITVGVIQCSANC